MISFFALPSYVGKFRRRLKDPSARRLSSRIRAEEMSAYLLVRLNPTDGFENDVCIYVKPRNLDGIRDGDWVDFLDGDKGLIGLLAKRPGVNVIAASRASYDVLRGVLQNQIVLIPSHHINQERFKRERTEINTAGYIGSPSPEAIKMYEDIGVELGEVGFDLRTCFNYKTRQDAIDLYRNIDIFVIGDWVGDDSPHKIPTKIINAASFGIPTIAYPLVGYKELEGYYVPSRNVDELKTEILKFKDEDYYKKWSSRVLEMAEPYHISNISQLYLNLDRC